MGGIIQVKLLGATPKVKYKFKPKAKMPKAIKAPKTNPPKTLHKKDPVNGVSQKKKVTQRFPKVLTEEAAPLEFTPKYHIEAKLFGAEFSFWEKIPTLIRYVILKTEFIKKHKGRLSTEHSDKLLKTAARLERLLGLILTRALPQHQLIMLEPLANLLLMPPQSLTTIIARINAQINDSKSAQKPITQLKSQLDTLIQKQTVEHVALCYQQLILLADLSPPPKKQSIVKLALQLQVQGLIKLKSEFQQQWLVAFVEGKTRQSIHFQFKVDHALPLFNFVPPTRDWYVKFEAIVSHINPVKTKVLFRFSAGSSSQAMLPLQTGGESLLSGRHVKFFKDKHDAADYLTSGFLFNLCQPFSEADSSSFERLKSQHQNRVRASLLSNLKLQQQITHQASRCYSETSAPEQSQKKPFRSPSTSNINKSLSYDFANFIDTERTKVPLLNQLLQEPVRLACRNPQYFSVKVSHQRYGMLVRKGDLGFQWVQNNTKKIKTLLDKLESQTEIIDTDKANLLISRKKIKLAITALHAEYHSYLSIVKQFDDASVSNYPEFRGIKQQFENDRGAKCRAEYLRAVICTHALLVLAYHQSLSAKHSQLNESEINFCRYLSRLTQEYEHPDCHVPREEVNCYLTMTSMLKDTQIERWQPVDLEIKLSHTSINRGIAVQRVISDDLDPYVDGDYLDIALFCSSVTHQIQPNPKWLFEALQQICSQADISPQAINFSELPDIDSSTVQARSRLNMQFKMGRSSSYEFQFLRISPQHKPNSHTHEYATSSSLSYWLKRYNACKDESNLENWQKLCAANEAVLQQLFDRIIVPNSHIANSIEEVANLFENQSTKRQLFKAILQWKKKSDLFPQVLSAFDAFLQVQNQCYRNKILARLTVLKARLER